MVRFACAAALVLGSLLGAARAADGPFVSHPEMTQLPDGLEPFDYQPANVPFYVPKADWGKMGEPITAMQKPLEPEASRRRALTPVGFTIALAAAEPLFQAKPLAFAFDHDGQLFVSESVDYPNAIVLPGEGEGRDRIVRLDDVNGDGTFDTRVVFAESLSICTSMLAHDGGLIVTQAPHTLFLKDTNGDGKADIRTELFTGWGTYDTHAGPSNLTWGLDGWIYGMVGYSGFKGEVGGETLEFKQGFFRFQPDGSKLEFLRSTYNNSWGVGFSEEGVLFGSTANGNPSEQMPLANRVYERVRGWNAATLGGISGSPEMEVAPRKGTADGKAPVRQVDHHGRFTAAAGRGAGSPEASVGRRADERDAGAAPHCRHARRMACRGRRGRGEQPRGQAHIRPARYGRGSPHGPGPWLAKRPKDRVRCRRPRSPRAPRRYALPGRPRAADHARAAGR